MNKMLRAARYALNLDRNELARAAGVSVSAIRGVESGSQVLPRAEKKILQALTDRGARITENSLTLVSA
jgi:transcriptional regulator with XRE-family HTH domain